MGEARVRVFRGYRLVADLAAQAGQFVQAEQRERDGIEQASLATAMPRVGRKAVEKAARIRFDSVGLRAQAGKCL
ncbi:hypothetical protein D9M70_607900 [compost metagenome]